MDTSYDLIVIGGGATGAGIALDASLRGLSVALFEQNDFAEGTSSRSTKLIHGGVRYLEAAIKHFSREQWHLVREGLHERKYFLHNAPHLAHPIELMTPLYHWYELPYVYAGLFLYDRISGRASLGPSRLHSAPAALQKNRAINPKGLKGAVSYFDGAFNDARMVIALLQSAQELGAKIHNHHRVTRLLKNALGTISGVEVYDTLGNTHAKYHAKAVINATGPFVDTIRRLDDPHCDPLIETSSGIHIVLSADFLPDPQGVMIPKTSDGRLIFALPWHGYCLVGTTDHPAPLSEHPPVADTDIDFLLEHVNRYFAHQATHDDILGTFSGLRPLIASSPDQTTATLVRESEYRFSPSGLLTVAGGKWTAYRAMAEEALDRLIAQQADFPHTKPCATRHYPLVGSHRDQNEALERIRKVPQLAGQAEELYSLYGDRAEQIVLYLNDDEDPELLRAQIRYTVHHEYVRKPLDFIVRRSGIGLTDQSKAEAILPLTCEVMSEELHWNKTTKASMEAEARELLVTSL